MNSKKENYYIMQEEFKAKKSKELAEAKSFRESQEGPYQEWLKKQKDNKNEV